MQKIHNTEIDAVIRQNEIVKHDFVSLALDSNPAKLPDNKNPGEKVCTTPKKTKTDSSNTDSPVGISEIEEYEFPHCQDVEGFSLLSGESKMFMNMCDES